MEQETERWTSNDRVWGLFLVPVLLTLFALLLAALISGICLNVAALRLLLRLLMTPLGI